MKVFQTTMHGLLGLLVCTQAFALPSESTIALYKQAANGDSDKVEQVMKKLQQTIDQQGVDALSLVYLGSSQTLMGRDAWMPWKKPNDVEQGLATIEKGLAMPDTRSSNAFESQRRQGER
jgi:hypothetical protein